MKVSEAFGLRKTQAELDFVDVDLERDAPLFVDPFAISQRLDSLSQECHLTLQAFFQRVVDSIRAGNDADPQALLLRLREPNETRLGYSRRRPKVRGSALCRPASCLLRCRVRLQFRRDFSDRSKSAN
jgi:hypothetical protein